MYKDHLRPLVTPLECQINNSHNKRYGNTTDSQPRPYYNNKIAESWIDVRAVRKISSSVIVQYVIYGHKLLLVLMNCDLIGHFVPIRYSFTSTEFGMV